MSSVDSIEGLHKFLRSLQSQLHEFDKDYKRSKRFDHPLTSAEELNAILGSNISAHNKKDVLLQQLGLARINLFMEFEARIKKKEAEDHLNEAVELMNDCAKLDLIPFVSGKEGPSFVSTPKRHSIFRRWDPVDYVRQWDKAYQEWAKLSNLPFRNKNLLREKYSKLRIIFNMLYAVSFSNKNFPS